MFQRHPLRRLLVGAIAARFVVPAMLVIALAGAYVLVTLDELPASSASRR